MIQQHYYNTAFKSNLNVDERTDTKNQIRKAKTQLYETHNQEVRNKLAGRLKLNKFAVKFENFLYRNQVINLYVDRFVRSS